MAQRTHEIRGSAGGNFNTVRFNVVDPPPIPCIPLDAPVKPVCHETKFRTKYKGIIWKKDAKKWRASIKITVSKNKYTKKHIGISKSEVGAAKMYDRFIYDNNLRLKGGDLRTTNYDLYGEYWK